jgi:hypothetical protein
MPDPVEISEDRGFKALITSYPFEAIDVFVPELLSERGRPVTVTVLQQEAALPDLCDPSRFLDVAILATWADGNQVVIMLVEHWSQARKVDLRRVAWYVADLALRHPLAVVYPVVLVTDPGARTVLDRWEMTVAGVTTLALRVRVYRVTAAELPRLRSLQNRVAAPLSVLALLDVMDAVDAVMAALEQMVRSPGPLEDVERFLPFVMKLARMPESDRTRFRRRLEETNMYNPLTEIRQEAEAKFRQEAEAKFRQEAEAKIREEAEAKARVAEATARAEVKVETLAQSSRATVATLRRLMERGVLTRHAVRAQLQDFMEAGAITREIGQEALSQLT